MLDSVINKRKRSIWKTIVIDYSIPLFIMASVSYFLEAWGSAKLLKLIFEIPKFGPLFYGTKGYEIYLIYGIRFGILFTVIFVVWFKISWNSIRIPGPGRPLFRWWRNLAQDKHKEEEKGAVFPPPFSYGNPDVIDYKKSLFKDEPLTRVLGYIKRFGIDIDYDKSMGHETENKTDFRIMSSDEGSRYYHTQVVGGSGSGKSASIIAPLLRSDAATSKAATITFNPKADLYLIKVMIDGVRKRKQLFPKDKLPTAIVSFVRKDSLCYDPLLFGDADTLTKKIIYSAEMTSEFYRAFQETWLMSFFRVVKTERLLNGRIMLRHLHRYLCNPKKLVEEILPLCQHEPNCDRIEQLVSADPKALAGVASHVSQFVEDESLAHIFDNPKGKYLDIRKVLNAGGNIFIEVDASSKPPQSRALGRMITMELQVLAGARHCGAEPKDKGIMAFYDEFAMFVYNDFIPLITMCRNAKIALLLAHQTVANMEKETLSRSFRDEIVDNCKTQIFLGCKARAQQWASDLFGKQRVIKRALSMGQNLDKTDLNARESDNVIYRDDMDLYLQPNQFDLPPGKGYAMVRQKDGSILKGPITVGYIPEETLCSNEEMEEFLALALQDHGTRPRNGSLIDNEIPPGEPHEHMFTPSTFENGAIADESNAEFLNQNVDAPKAKDKEENDNRVKSKDDEPQNEIEELKGDTVAESPRVGEQANGKQSDESDFLVFGEGSKSGNELLEDKFVEGKKIKKDEDEADQIIREDEENLLISNTYAKTSSQQEQEQEQEQNEIQDLDDDLGW